MFLRALAILALTSSCPGRDVAFAADPPPSVIRATTYAEDGDAVVTTTTTRPADRVDLPVPWAADVFYSALANFTVREDAGPLSTACRRQTQMYVRHLKINSYWAVKSEYSIGQGRSLDGTPGQIMRRRSVTS